MGCGNVAPIDNEEITYQMIKQGSRSKCGTFCFLSTEMKTTEIDKESIQTTVMCIYYPGKPKVSARWISLASTGPNGSGMY